MAKALIRFPGRLEELTTTEMKHSIREANLGKDDTRIAEPLSAGAKASD